MNFLRYRLTSYAPHILGGLAVVYFIFHMISGDRGLISYIKAKNEFRMLSNELVFLKERNDSLENKISLIRDDSIDYDMLEEQSMRLLGIAKKGDVVIFIDSPQKR